MPTNAQGNARRTVSRGGVPKKTTPRKGVTPGFVGKTITHGYSKMKRPPRKGRVIVLAPRTYDKLERLVFWYEATPQEIDLGDYVWECINRLVDEYLIPVLAEFETATVETGRRDLIAVVEDDKGNETRVPVLRRGEPL